MVVGRTEPFVSTRSIVDLVTTETHVAERKVVARKARLEIGFQPAIVLHPVGQCVADIDNVGQAWRDLLDVSREFDAESGDE